MASIFDFSSTAGSNTSCDGVNISDGMSAKNVDNAIRSLMAIIRQTFSSTLQSFLSGASALGVGSGGTGATTAADARTNLGLGSAATESTVPIAKGGTGAITAASAFANIAVAASSLSANGYIKLRNGLIIQWGKGASQAGSDTPSDAQTVTFPTAFAGTPFAVLCTTTDPSGNVDSGWQVYNVTASSFRAHFAKFEAGTGTGAPYWIAVGN